MFSMEFFYIIFFLVQWVRRYVFFLISRVVSILPAHYGVGSFACVKPSGWLILTNFRSRCGHGS